MTIDSRPRVPSTRSDMRSTDAESIDAVTVPVAPPGNRSWTLAKRSMPGLRWRIVAAATSGSSPTAVLAQWTA